MKKHLKNIAITAAILLTITMPAWAGMAAHGGHGSMTHDMQGSSSRGGHHGKLIHEAMVDGYQLSYHLIDMKAKMKDMKMEMPMQMATHHLMVYIQDEDGNPVKADKVGYLVAGPDGEKQKAMAMSMSGGYGADITLKGNGSYGIHTKILLNDGKVMDAFNYSLE